jgi:hypothetical protein
MIRTCRSRTKAWAAIRHFDVFAKYRKQEREDDRPVVEANCDGLSMAKLVAARKFGRAGGFKGLRGGRWGGTPPHRLSGTGRLDWHLTSRTGLWAIHSATFPGGDPAPPGPRRPLASVC